MYVGYVTPAHNCDVRRPLQNINQFHKQQIRQQFHPFHSHLLRSSNKIFDSRLFRHNKIFWKKILKEACSPLFYTSFGTFCAQIGQLFELQWIFEVCLKSTNRPHGRKMLLISEFFRLLKDSLCRYMNGWLSKIISVHMHAMPRTFFGVGSVFDNYC